MDVTFQRQDLLEIAGRASGFRDSMLRLRTDAHRLIVSATGRIAAEEPISKVVADTLVPAVVSVPGTANADPAELGKQAQALTTVQARLVAISVWPGFELSGIDPNAPGVPVVVPRTTTLPVLDPSHQVAALIRSGTITIRRPWTVPLFGTLTLGIYLGVWYYRINRELRELGALCGESGRELDVKPGRSTLAVSLGAVLLVPPFVSVQRTLRRIQKAERITGAPDPHLRTGVAWALFLLVLPFWSAYVQAHLNRTWREELRRAQVERAVATLEASADAPMTESPAPLPSIEPWPVASSEAVIPALAATPPPPAPVPPRVLPSPPPAPAPVPASAPVQAPPPSPPAQTPPAIPASPPPPPPPPALVPPLPPPAVAPAPAPKPDIHDPAIEIIRARYARGEITREEYRALLSDLS